MYEEDDIEGTEFIGDEIDDVLADMGVSGTSEVGRRAKRSLRGLFRRFGSLGGGKARNFPLFFDRSVALADAGSDDLTGTADREGMAQAFFVGANDASGTGVQGCSLTNLKVNGRNASVGSGFAPVFEMFGQFAQTASKDAQWFLGLMKNGGTIVATLQNDSGAAADIYAGARMLTTD